ncbi:MAG: TrkH family potassium uptake protein [Clostridia bacterium]|nr:TrkH family potassium uptake protein [Clostridia bacterium]
MNHRMVLRIIGLLVLAEAALLTLPALVSLIYGEASVWSLLITMAVCAAVGGLLVLVCRTKNKTIYARDGFVIVSLGWLTMSALGAMPFVISGEIPNYIDAFFETVSGFTTTGASIIPDLSKLSHGILFWRSFTHWVGGMGVLVFILAIIPNIADRSIHIMRAESPGPVVGKIVPRMKDTAMLLYIMYIGLTLIEVVLLLCGGLSLFESLVYSFGTAGTGGFGIRGDSIASYSPYIQWVIGVFMMLFGVNFNIYYLLLVRKLKAAFGSTELRVYLGIILASTAVIAFNIRNLYSGLPEIIRVAFFQVSSVMTTTGYSTVDFSVWPELSKGILLVLMLIGGCAGSTGGGMKVSRVVILFKSAKKEIKRLLHPRTVSYVKFEGKKLDEQVIGSVGGYFILYFALMIGVMLLLSFDSLSFEEYITGAISCFNNIGPAEGRLFGGYMDYSGFSKLVLSFAMLAGRLEIYPMLLLLLPSTWIRKGF